jgi:hypothetical protein
MEKHSNLSVIQGSANKQGEPMTSQEVLNKIIDLKKKNRNVNLIQGGLAVGGSILGLVYAFKKNKKFWGKVGYWILGGIVVGVPTSIGARLINSDRNAELLKIQNYLENQKKKQ